MMPSALTRPDTGFALAMLLCLFTVTVGCKAPVYTDFDAFVAGDEVETGATEYRMSPPDVITIRSKRVRELDGLSQQIRPDGKLDLPLLGTVNVAGRTPEDVSAQLELLAQEYYHDADVSLSIAQYRSQQIFVFGEVGRAGPQRYTGTNTVLNTLASAQPTRLADPDRITIVRPGKADEPPARMTIDLNHIVREGDRTLDAMLEEGDIIYVPPNPLARTGLAIGQLLLPLQPAAQVVQSPTSIDRSVRGWNRGDQD